MTIHRTSRIEIDDFLLESETHALMEQIDNMERHIKRTVPDELLYVNGNLNPGTRWGCVLHHITMLRATLRAFL